MSEKFVWGGLHPFMYHPLIFDLIPDIENKTVVDCGCGKGIWGYLIRATRKVGTKGKLIGIDLNAQYLNHCKTHNVYHKVIKSSITSIPLPENSVDFLICSEVIEHLTPEEGEKFLFEVDRIMKPGGRAIITTPNVELETYIKSGADSHSSLWTVEKFVSSGFKVRGMGIKISPGFGKWYTKIVLGLYYLFTPFTYFFPDLAAYLMATRDY